MKKEIIGSWKIYVVENGKTVVYFAERFSGETVADALNEALASFDHVISVKGTDEVIHADLPL